MKFSVGYDFIMTFSMIFLLENKRLVCEKINMPSNKFVKTCMFSLILSHSLQLFAKSYQL